MKKILVSVLAVAAMVACSTEHTVVKVENNEAIGFDTFVDKTTRAEDITTANIANFGVYASVTNSQDASALILTNEKVTKNGDVWGYTNTQHWVPGNSYNFTAIAPFEGRHWTYTTGTQAQNGVINFKNNLENAAGEQDLVFAYAERANVAAGAQTKVGLTFSHLLSKVAFKFTNGYAANDNMTLEVYGIKINNAVAEAKVAVVDGAVKEWEQTNTATFERTFGKQTAEGAILAATDAYTTEHHYLLPIAQQYSITFTIDLYQAGVKVGQYVHTITPEIAFAKGGNYCISATLNEKNTGDTAFEAIEFTVEGVNEWVDNGSVALTTVEVASAKELAEAVALGQNVVLADDITLTETLVVNPISATRAAANHEMVLDLNGKTLTNAVDNTATDVIVVSEGATLTINGEGTVEAVTGNDGYAVIAEGTVIINGGTFKSGIDENDEPNAVVYARGNGQVYVNGGNFPNDNSSKFVLNKKDADRATTVIEVRGGKFGAFNPADNAAETAGTNFVAEGYGSYELEENVWTVVSKTTAIEVASEAALWDVAEQGGNAVLAKDIVLSGCVDICGDVTLNLNGKTLTVPATATGYKDVFYAYSTANVTINGEGSLIAEDGYAVWAAGNSNVVINGGYYFSPVSAVYAYKNAAVAINGGTFKVDGTNNADGDCGQVYTLNLHDSYRETSSISVNGGKYYNFNPANNYAEGANTNFVADGKTVEQNGDWYIVK